MWMKAHVDGMRSMVYFVAYCFDKVRTAEDEKEAQRYQGFIELLTPVIKAYCTDRGFDVCVQAIQVYGGYGYTKEYPVEQLARDCKISSIYEGTNGIQAMDLLGRKLGMKGGEVFMEYLKEIQRTIAQAKKIPDLVPLAQKVEEAVSKLGETALHIGKTAMSPDLKVAFAHALPFLHAMGDVTLAWMHLWRAKAALPWLEKKLGSTEPAKRREAAEKNKDVAFYDGQVRTADFFICSVLPQALGTMEAIKNSCSAAVEIAERSFGGI